MLKLSGHRDADQKYLEQTHADIEKEYKIAKALGVHQELFPHINISERNQAFSQPLTPLSDMINPTEPSRPLPPKKLLEKGKVVEKVDQLFEVIIGLLTQIDTMHNLRELDGRRIPGLVHADIKPNNILVKKTTDDDGSTHFVPFITDFGLTTEIGHPSKEEHLEGYSLPKPEGTPNTRGRDFFALGVTFDELLGLLFSDPDNPFSFKYQIEHLPRPKQIAAITLFQNLRRDLLKISAKMHKTDRTGRNYANEDLRCDDLIREYAALRGKFKDDIGRL